MNRPLVAVALLVASTALATPGGETWPLNTCTTSCTSPTSGQTTNNAICVTGRCLPEVRFAASINNTGGMTLTGSQAVPYATALVGMQSGFSRWTSAQVTSCGTSLNFSFQGTFSSPTLTAAVNGGDGNNNVIFLTNPNWRYGSGTLGLTGTRFFTTGELTDADMEMNGNTAWANDGRSSAWDYESVIAHEAGHFIGFDHTTSGNAVMNPSVANGTIKRALLGPDLSDVCTTYPGTNGGQGSSCTTMTMCTGGRVCEGPTGSTSRICTQDCTAVGQTCPAGFSCQASTAGFACLPQVGASDLCRFCTRGSDCSTGTCLTDGMGRNWCSVSCNPSTPNSCGPGYTCATFSSGNAFCQPATACTTQCTPATVATDCAPGYACTGGTCTPTGNPGDRCDASEFCLQCGLCIIDDVDPNLSYCRSCCNGQGECMGCTATTCQPVMGSPASCLPLSGSPEQVCIPTSGAALCTACNAGTPCQAGLICAAGVCRSPCNPSNPGACPACIGLSGGGGVCACGAGEVSDEGQSCTNTVPLRICRTGLRCVSGTCRTSCNPSAPTPCSAGFTCSNVGGLFFCLPGGAGGGSAGTGGGGSGTGGGAAGGSATGGGRAGGTAGGVAGGSAAGGSAGGSPAGGSAAGGSAAGGSPAGGAAAGGSAAGGAAAGGSAAGGTAGVGGGTAGGLSGTGGAGAGGPGLTCSPSTCNGCCSAGICVSFPSTDRCGANGSECRACGSTQTCNAGMCVERPPASCLSCSSVGWSPLVLAVLAFFARRRR